MNGAKSIINPAKTIMNAARITLPIRSMCYLLPAMLGLCGSHRAGRGSGTGWWYCGDIHVHRDCGSSPTNVAGLHSVMAAVRTVTLNLADMGNGEVQNATTDLPRLIFSFDRWLHCALGYGVALGRHLYAVSPPGLGRAHREPKAHDVPAQGLVGILRIGGVPMPLRIPMHNAASGRN